MPYYLLLVGDPGQIPYRFQSQLDVQYAVGRIHFDDIAGCSNYAPSIVKAEKNKPALAKEAVFFGVANPDDPATRMSLEQLVYPLADEMMAEGQNDWKLKKVLKEEATKKNLACLLADQSMTVSEVLRVNTEQLVSIIKRELELRESKLQDELHTAPSNASS